MANGYERRVRNYEGSNPADGRCIAVVGQCRLNLACQQRTTCQCQSADDAMLANICAYQWVWIHTAPYSKAMTSTRGWRSSRTRPTATTGLRVSPPRHLRSLAGLKVLKVQCRPATFTGTSARKKASRL